MPGGAGAVSGRNQVSAGSMQLGTGAAGIVGSGGGAGTEAPDFDAAPGGTATGARSERKVSRVAVRSTSADPVDVARDAAIPPRPNPYSGRASTAVTIKFTVQLRAPQGRDLSGSSGKPADEPTEETPAEGEQQ
jgi:hypothetical protein